MRMVTKLSYTCALGLFGLVAACSDPVPPAGQGAVSLYLTTFTGSMAGIACPASPHWVNIPDAPGGQQNTADHKGAVAVDGQDQAGITCTVKDTGGPFSVSASLKVPAKDPTTGMAVNPTLVTLQTTISPDSGAQGTVTILDAKTASTYSSTNDAGQADATCMFSVKKLKDSDGLGIAPGRIWASVNCPRFRDTGSSNLNEVCSVSSGFAILENCLQ
jgi:hypothetical protein